MEHSSSQGKLRYGFRDSTIPVFAAVNRGLFSTRSALITCVDSCTTPALAVGWMRLLTINGVKFERVDNFVWIPSSCLVQSFDIPRAFTGFDEIYLVRRKPDSTAAISKHFTSDGVKFDEAPPVELGDQMQSIMADLYVADGCGLNLAVSSDFDGDLPA